MTGIERLTQRERQICELAAQGRTHKETAASLGIAPGTVKVYMSRCIFPKLGVTNQAGLIRYWIERVEMPERGDCSKCSLRQDLLGGPHLTQID